MSIIPIITKLFELIILSKCPELSNNNTSQFGFTSNPSTLNAELIIRDTVSYYNKRETPVYICSLDAEKAFDCCNWLTLFTKLLKMSIPNAILSFLIQLYLNGTAMVQCNGSICFHTNRNILVNSERCLSRSNPISISVQHIHRRPPAGDKVAKDWCFSPNNYHTAIVVYADDIILLSPNLKHLQTMISH